MITLLSMGFSASAIVSGLYPILWWQKQCGSHLDPGRSAWSLVFERTDGVPSVGMMHARGWERQRRSGTRPALSLSAGPMGQAAAAESAPALKDGGIRE